MWSQLRTPIHIVTSHADMADADSPVHPNANLEISEYIEMIRWLYQSARLFHPKVTMSVITSAHTNLRGLDIPFKRVDCPFSPASIMQDRAAAQVGYLDQFDFSAPLLFLDPDILINGSLSQLASEDFDIALTWRMSEVMPINGGVIFVSGRRPEIIRSFFRRYLAIYQQEYADQKQWFGDQMALRDAVGLNCSQISPQKTQTVKTAEGATCLLLPAHSFNRSPHNRLNAIVEPIKDAAILHFKGERKRLMKLYWQAHLEGLMSPLPFKLPLPWRMSAARAVRAALRRAATAEEMALSGQACSLAGPIERNHQ